MQREREKERYGEKRHGEKRTLRKALRVPFQYHFHNAFTAIQKNPNPILALKCLLNLV